MSSTAPADAILKTLNKAQLRAVTSSAKTVAILAGPGSGKTHTLTSRVVWLIDHVGYAPEDIIVATFTVKAAREMKERIGHALGNGREKKLILGTFHSVARRYLAAYGNRIGLDQKFGIADDGDSRAILRRVIKRLDLGLDPAAARAWISKRKAKGTAESSKPGDKGQMNTDLLRCYEEYQSHLQRSNLLDYDDLLTCCVELLTMFPACVSNVQAVLIDEYQDTNGIQYELMRLFAQANNKITIVGDPDQSIYGWRSAEIKNLHRMLSDYPRTDQISLEENYRSSERILALSLRVIQQDSERYQKVLLPTHMRGTRPVLRRLKTSSVEADWIVSEIQRLTMMMGHMASYDDVAILLRSASLSRHIETALGRAGIPYRMVGGFKFYERAEIKILLDYLRVIYQPDNNDALARILNVPKRGFGEQTIKNLVEEAETTQRSLWTLLIQHCRGDRTAKTKLSKKMEQNFSGGLQRVIERLRQKTEKLEDKPHCNLEDLLNQLLEMLKFKPFLEETYGPEQELRWANVQDFVALAKDFMRELEVEEEDALPDIEGLEQARDADILGRFLSNVSLASDAQKGDKAEDNKPLVTISTIHAAKGLEWPVVMVPSVYEGMIPHGRSEDLSEDRRLLYVAMTRAKAFLYISCPRSNARGEEVQLSQFLPTDIAKGFAPRGPSLERQVLEETAKILGRVVPTQDSIFEKLPPMFCPEDDLFPLDPEEADTRVSQAGMRGETGVHRQKRQRIQIGGSGPRESSEPQWQRPYATTMEQSGNFTIPALSGFVSATVHHVNLREASDAEEKTINHMGNKVMEPKKTVKGTTQRSANQMSMWRFLNGNESTLKDELGTMVKTKAGQSRITSTTEPPYSVPARAAPSQVQKIAPELANHRVSSVTMMRKPVVMPETDDGPVKRYACFSSSPTKPTDINEFADPVPAKPQQPAIRPASTFHSTTMTALRTPGVKKPPGFKGDGGSALSTLRKPFKPLTFNRSGADGK